MSEVCNHISRTQFLLSFANGKFMYLKAYT
jgi:hypothetical protein